MCTGIELALILGGTAASVGGAAISRNDALSNAAAVSRARNDVLRTLTQKENDLEQRSRTEGVQKALDRFSPEAQATASAEDVARRNSAIDSAITTTQGVDDIPLTGNAPRIVKDQIGKHLRDVFSSMTDRAKAMALPLSYNDTLAGNNVALGNAGRVVNTYNSFARQEAAMLPGQQELAGYAASRTPSIWGPVLSAAGQAAAAAGGSGALKGLGSLTAPAAANGAELGGLYTSPQADAFLRNAPAVR